jgi:hypothetical protein
MVLLLLIVALAFGCAQKSQETGTLKGTVAIGPLCPVEPCNLSPGMIAKALEGRKIVVYTQDKAAIMRVIDIYANGTYSAELAPGTYSVDINKIGLDRSAEVPKEITIEVGKTVELDIDIDTGMR